jgi:Mrp family chromosome partitioning ATPase
VVVVDGDDRARGLSQATGAVDAPGLTDLTATDADLADKALAVPTGGGHALRVVPAGRPVAEPAGFYRTPAFRRAMGVIRDDAELVVVDSPPLLAVADTSAIASQVDGIVLVVDQGTRLRDLAETRDRLALIGTPLLGYVFNRDPERSERYAYRAAAAARPALAARRSR